MTLPAVYDRMSALKQKWCGIMIKGNGVCDDRPAFGRMACVTTNFKRLAMGLLSRSPADGKNK
jgi:hypothetical protein